MPADRVRLELSAKLAVILAALQAKGGIASIDRTTTRPLPFLGPYRGNVPAWDCEFSVYRWIRIDAADYSVSMSRRWRLDSGGYPCVHTWDAVANKSIVLYLHRLIGRAGALDQVDHVHHQLDDCRRSELRLATPSQNSANTRRLSIAATKSSVYRGVTKHKQTGRWQAAAKHADRCLYLGLYDLETEAARAYDAKAYELWGDFARLNFAAGRVA